MMKETEKSRRQFVCHTLFAAILFICIYGLLGFRFGPFTDEIWDLTGQNHGIYIAGGRWGVSAYRWLMSDKMVPFAYMLAGAVYMGLTFALLVRILNIKLKEHVFILGAMVLGIVQLSYLMIVAYHTDAVCLGMLLTVGSYYLLLRGLSSKPTRTVALTVPAIAFAMATYQSLILLIPCLLMGQYILAPQTRSVREWTGIALRIGSVCIGSLVFYFITKTISLHWASPEEIAGVQAYQAGLVTWGQLDLVTHVLHLGKQTVEHWLGLTYRSEWIFATCIIPAAVLAWQTIRERKQVLLGLGCLAGLYFLPFISLWILGEDAGARLHFAQPFVAGILWVAALQRSRVLARVPQTVLIGISAFIILKASYTVCEMAFLQKRMHEDDVRRMQAVQQRAWLTPVPEGVDVFSCPIVVVGEQDFYVPDDFKSCIRFSASTNGRRCLYNYLGMKGMKDIGESSTPREEVRELVKTMPLYPASGCTMYYKGEIIVNFNDAPPKKKETR